MAVPRFRGLKDSFRFRVKKNKLAKVQQLLIDECGIKSFGVDRDGENFKVTVETQPGFPHPLSVIKHLVEND